MSIYNITGERLCNTVLYNWSVKKKLVALLIVYFCCMVQNIVAQQHSVGISTDISFPMMLDKMEVTTNKFGLGGDVRFVYQYQYRYLLLNMGGGVNFEHTNQKIKDMDDYIVSRDTRETLFKYMIFIDKRSDMENVLSVSVPVSIGFEIKHFYMLVGGTFVMPIYNNVSQKANFSSIGEYNWIAPAENIANQGFVSNQEVVDKDKIKISPDFRAEVEIGYRLTQNIRMAKKKNSTFKISLFGQISCLDIVSSDNIKQPIVNIYYSNVYVDYANYVSIHLNNVYKSNMVTGIVRKLTVGIRFSYIIPVAGTLHINHSNGMHYKRFGCRQCDSSDE